MSVLLLCALQGGSLEGRGRRPQKVMRLTALPAQGCESRQWERTTEGGGRRCPGLLLPCGASWARQGPKHGQAEPPLTGVGDDPLQNHKTFSRGCRSWKEGICRGLLRRGFLKVNVGFVTDAASWVEFFCLFVYLYFYLIYIFRKL